MNLTRLAWLVGTALLVMVINVAASVLYMIVYSHLIEPGHEKQYYDDHIQVAAPYCSIVAGIPLMFLTGWWISGWWQGENSVGSALVVVLAYAVIDLSVLLAVGLTWRIALLFAISFITKLAAAVFGGVIGSRNL